MQVHTHIEHLAYMDLHIRAGHRKNNRKKVSDIETNNQHPTQPTPDNLEPPTTTDARHPTTWNHLQQPTPDNLEPPTTTDTRHPTTWNHLQQPTPTPDNQHWTTDTRYQ
jgi:hypothetical protein